jgi:hypothetical protein
MFWERSWMSTIETHGFVLWGVPRFHRQIAAPTPQAAPERKPPKAAEPDAPPIKSNDETEPAKFHAA